MVNVPTRCAPGLASYVKPTVALPVPLWLAGLRCNHETLAVAVQVAFAGVTVSVTLLLPAV